MTRWRGGIGVALGLALWGCTPGSVDEAPQPPAVPPALASASNPAATAQPTASAAPASPSILEACDSSTAYQCAAGAAWLYRTGAFERAAKLFRLACDAGSGTACRRLASMMGESLGMPRSPPKAFALVTRGCELGDGLACVGAAESYEDGWLAPPDAKKAVEARARAAQLLDSQCSGGSAVACSELGNALIKGQGAPKSEARGKLMLERAAQGFTDDCERGDGDACLELARARIDGKTSPAVAGELFEKACLRGSATGCTEAVRFYFESGIVAKDEARSKRLAEVGVGLLGKRCDLGAWQDCDRAAQMLIKVLGDPGRARGILRAACERDVAETCVGATVGEPDRAVVSALDKRGFKLFEAACGKDDAFACGELGGHYLEGIGVAKDPAKGTAALLRSCTLGYAMGCFQAGEVYRQGTSGARKDPVRAKEMYAKGCALGFVMSCGQAP